ARLRHTEIAERRREHAVVPGGGLDDGLELVDRALVLPTSEELPAELGAHEERTLRLLLELALKARRVREVALIERESAKRTQNRLVLARIGRAPELLLEVRTRRRAVAALLEQVRERELGGGVFRLFGGGARVAVDGALGVAFEPLDGGETEERRVTIAARA